MLRFEHLFEAHELADSSPININLNEDIFKGLRITHLTEMGLGGDRPISEIGKKVHWKKVCNKIQSCQNTLVLKYFDIFLILLINFQDLFEFEAQKACKLVFVSIQILIIYVNSKLQLDGICNWYVVFYVQYINS